RRHVLLPRGAAAPHRLLRNRLVRGVRGRGGADFWGESERFRVPPPPPSRLAATCSWRLLPRDYLSVDVPRACAAVEAFVIGRGGWEVPPPPAGAPPPRCSLYLAALLQLGLARVYGRQCGWLLEEAAQVLGRLQRARPPPNIDLSPPRRLQLVADAQALMAALELAPDPFFGVMGPGLPSPMELPQVLPHGSAPRLCPTEPPPPPQAPPTSPHRLPPQVRRLLEELPPVEVPPPPVPPPTVSPEKITLREPEPIVLPAIEEELPEVTARELQLLMEVEAELLPPALRPPEEPTLPPPPPEVNVGQPWGSRWLPPDLWGLWGRCARPPPPPPPAPPELPSEVEVLREALEPSLPALPSSEISLEITEEELRPRLLPPEERR
ncbi:meiotic recombination protein REC8 homolog, partial [Morphnus guianensis]